MGLCVCKKIVEQRGGWIWIESEIGKGTKFFFTVPNIIDTILRKEINKIKQAN